jgi:hypothetical protein
MHCFGFTSLHMGRLINDSNKARYLDLCDELLLGITPHKDQALSMWVILTPRHVILTPLCC